jgi:hypothetical protein
MISNQLFIEFKSDLLKIKDKEKLEEAYYEKLSKCLKSAQFKAFELLIDASIEFNIFIDINRITNRFKIISKLILNCVDKISTGYQTSALGEIIEILRLSNRYNLLDKEINKSEKNYLNSFKNRNKLFLENLNDLFEKTSDSFILYICKVMPQDFYNYFVNSPISFFPDYDGLMDYIKNSFFNQYTVYGLNIRYLSSIEKFFVDIKNKLRESQDNNLFIEIKVSYKYQIFYYDTEEEHEQLVEKIHLISPKNIIDNKSKIFDKNNYNFYSLSMVLLGGLGPQGLGFTYSTPKGEVVEICSDQSESEAIIIKYKQYLTKRFLDRLDQELMNLEVRIETRVKLKEYLLKILNPKDLISYHDKNSILKELQNFLFDEFDKRYKGEQEEIIHNISKAISVILREIKLEDQFKTRMDLVDKGDLKAEEIAKLTSLKGKSHYDVLRERFFFQYIVDWFYELFSNKKLKIEKPK